MTSYICVTNERRNVSNYLVPSISHTFCQQVLLRLLLLSKGSIYTFFTAVGPARNIPPFYHGLAGQVSNNYKNTTRDSVCYDIKIIAALDGHPLPIHVRQVNGSFSDSFLDIYNVIVLPPKHNIFFCFTFIQIRLSMKNVNFC